MRYVKILAYCKMDPISKEMNIDKIPLTQCDKWLQAAGILNGTDITTTDTGLCFFKFRKRAIDYDEFLQFLQDLAYTKKLDYEEVQRKLLTCSDPSSQDLQKES